MKAKCFRGSQTKWFCQLGHGVRVDKPIDLVMWTKNGARTLPLVLRRINSVIPRKAAGERFIVDDGSTDKTRRIGESLGWQVILNEGRGISDGANTALRNVTSDYFVSLEQDLLLAKDWWAKVPPSLSQPKVAVASGIRFSSHPPALIGLQEYTIERYMRKELPAYLRGRETSAFFLAKTLDNTIYRTEVIREIGGFPRLSVAAGIDHALAHLVHMSGYEWKVNYNVRSTHLRRGIRDELAHRHWYGTCLDGIEQMIFQRPADLSKNILQFVVSPIMSLHVVVTKKNPQAFCVYPLMRFYTLKGIFDGRRKPTNSVLKSR
jgi:glycosyltransferase involved in cell wall biosynthesis